MHTALVMKEVRRQLAAGKVTKNGSAQMWQMHVMGQPWAGWWLPTSS
jgi:hypothetical protein